MDRNYVSVSNISKEYPGVLALDNVSFSIKEGSIHGFLGPNGAGKTTCLSIIVGLIPPSSGEVLIGGKNIKKIESKKIGFLPEHPPLYNYMTVIDYIKFSGRINSLSSKESIVKADEIISKLNLTEVKNRLINNLSKGFKQRVGIAQALVYDPEFIVLDEPAVGLDPKSLVEMRELILSLKEKHTILLSSHQLSEVDQLCSDITIINKGRIIESGKKEEIRKSFQTRQVIEVEVTNWSGEIENIFIDSFSIERIDRVEDSSIMKLKIFFKSDDDQRGEVSKFLIENNCKLLYINHSYMNLEEIFNEAVEGKDNERN